MSRPRALVVRSGTSAFRALEPGAGIEILEKVSHAIQRVEPSPDAFGAPADFTVLTSKVTVDRVLEGALAPAFRRCAGAGLIVAVGPATEAALRSRGLAPAIVASGSAESLLEALPGSLAGRHIVFPCGEDGSREVPRELRARGARVTRVVVYRKVRNPPDPSLDREILDRPFAAFCATSPSAARWLFEGVGPGAAERLRHTPAVALGPSTRRYLESCAVERIEVPEEARFSAAALLLEALATVPSGK